MRGGKRSVVPLYGTNRVLVFCAVVASVSRISCLVATIVLWTFRWTECDHETQTKILPLTLTNPE